MREKFFRVWDEGYMDYDVMVQDSKAYRDPDVKYNTPHWEVSPYSDKAVVMQYIGLEDKKGTKIFEGDLVDLHQTINGVSKFIVEWSQKRLGWTLRYAENMVNPRTYEYDVSDVFSIEEIEVIGNIHENKEK